MSGIFNKLKIGSDLNQRVRTAIILIAVFLLLSVFAAYSSSGKVILVGLAFALSGMAAFEVSRLFARDPQTARYQPFKGGIFFLVQVVPLFVALVSALQVAIRDGRLPIVGFLAMNGFYCILTAIYLVMCGRKNIHDLNREVLYAPLAVLFVGGCGSALMILVSINHSVALIWWLIAVVTLNDSAAYFVGHAFGRTPLAPAISPNKTVEGWIGGTIIGVLAGVLLWNFCIQEEAPLLIKVCVSWVVVVGAQTGDLIKSYLKRLAGVKDSGNLFPGHGGVLDRFDGLLGGGAVFAMYIIPFCYY